MLETPTQVFSGEISEIFSYTFFLTEHLWWLLLNRFRRVVLYGKCSSWSSVLAWVSQGFILESLLFLIYINDLSDNLQSTAKLFVDDILLFSTVYDPNTSASQLDSDLKQSSHWAYKWKMTFHHDLPKQVIFSGKNIKISHPSLTFNFGPVARTTYQKHRGLCLDEKLVSSYHVNVKISNVNKEI